MNTPNQEPIFPPLERVEGAYLELQDHNERHTGLGSAVGKLMMGLIDQASDQSKSGVQPDLIEYSMPDMSVEVGMGDISENLLHETADPVFEAVGLSRFGGQTVAAGDAAITSPTQELFIVHPTKFGELLDQSRGRLAEFPATREMITKVYRNLLRTVRDSVSPENGLTEEQREWFKDEALDMLEKLQPKYQELASADDLNAPLEVGISYLNWGRKPEFADFLAASDLGIREPHTFSAAEWHLDSNAQYYLDRWMPLIQHYDAVVEKYGPDNDLAVHMKFGIQDAAAAVSDWLRVQEYPNPYAENLKPAIDKVLAQAKERKLF